MSTLNDLPPRTWHGRWLAWPKWLRIGVWAAMAVVVLHIAIAVRMAIGLIEDGDIGELRRRGAEVYYRWEPRFTMSQPIPGYAWLCAGLQGRSASHVVDVVLAGSTDADLQLICTRFPNLKRLWLTEVQATDTGFQELPKLRGLWFLGIEDTDIGDKDVAFLPRLDSLHWLSLSETRVTDKVIPTLQQMKSLGIVGVQFTDVSWEAITQWQQSGKIRIDTEKKPILPTELFGSIRWSDGRRMKDFQGPAVLTIESPSTPAMTASHPRMPGIIRFTAADLLKFGDGDYRFSLTLGGYDAESVVIPITGGRPSANHFEFQMPVTKQQALVGKP